jgi:putative peptidoglycan lipid II flippase
MLRDAYVARAFGLNEQMDGYLMAQTLALLPLGVIFIVLQPILTAALSGTTHPIGATRVPWNVWRAVKLGFIALTVVFVVTWSLLPLFLDALASHVDVVLVRATRSAYVWLAAGAMCNAVSTLGYGILYARGRLLLGGMLPAVVPAVMVVVLLAFPGTASASRLGSALFLGYLAEACVVVVTVLRHGVILFDSHARSPSRPRIVRQAIPMMAGMLVLGTGPLVEQSFAVGLGAGAVSAIGFASRVPVAIGGIVATAVSAAFLPIIARELEVQATARARRTFRMTAVLMVTGGCAAALLLWYGSGMVVHLLYVGGRFDAADAAVVAHLQAVLGFAIPAAIVSALAGRVLIANAVAALHIVIPLITLAALVAFNTLLVPGLAVTGIAVSNVLAAVLNGVLVVLGAEACLRRVQPSRANASASS